MNPLSNSTNPDSPPSSSQQADEPAATKDWPIVKEAGRAASAQLDYYREMMGNPPPAAAQPAVDTSRLDRRITRLTQQVADLQASRDYWASEAHKARDAVAPVPLPPEALDKLLNEFAVAVKFRGLDERKAAAEAIHKAVEAAIQENFLPTADDLKEPENGANWRVEWWSEHARLMLPAEAKLDSVQSYSNGTFIFTIKRAVPETPTKKGKLHHDQP